MSDLFSHKLNRRRLVQGAATGAMALGIPSMKTSAAPDRSNAPTILRLQNAKKIRVLMWSNSPTIDTNFKNRAKAFNEAHQGQIQVDFQLLPYEQYWQKIQLAYSASQPYDIYFWDVQAYGHYKKGLLLNLQPMMNQAGLFNPAQYPTELFKPWKLDGENFYALPENFQTAALYYNKKLFDEAQLAVPDDTWTWEQVINAARKLTKRSGDRVTQWGMSLGVLGIWWGLQTISWAKGTAFVDKQLEPTKFQFSDPKNVETLRFAQNLVYKEQVAPSPAIQERSGDTLSFQSGRIGLTLDGSWTISSDRGLPFEWGVAPLPKWGGNRVVPYWTGGWVIAKASKAPEAAFEWAKWSATSYQATMAKEHDWIPIQNAARTSQDMLSGMPAGFKEVIDALSNARLGDFYCRNVQQIWTEAFDPNFQQLFNSKKSPDEVAKAIDAKANSLL